MKHWRTGLLVLALSAALLLPGCGGQTKPEGSGAASSVETREHQSAQEITPAVPGGTGEGQTQPTDEPGQVPQPTEPSPQLPGEPDKSAEQTPPAEEPPQADRCTFSVSCAVLLDHLAELEEGKAALVPRDGLLLPARSAEIQEGDTVFDLLSRLCREEKLHMEYVDTPGYGSAYVEGIGNLYEHDCGPLSGWIYRVNGEAPAYGCSAVKVKDGDVVEWLYTCDLGADLGDEVPQT